MTKVNYIEFHGFNCSPIVKIRVKFDDTHEADDYAEKFIKNIWGRGAYNTGLVSYKLVG